jgi:hypothetical protein
MESDTRDSVASNADIVFFQIRYKIVLPFLHKLARCSMYPMVAHETFDILQDS